MKTFKFLISLVIFISSLISQRNAYLVNVVATNRRTGDEELYCAMKKPKPNDDYDNWTYKLFSYGDSNQNCVSNQDENKTDPHAVFIEYNYVKFRYCSLASSFNNVVSNTTDYVIIGSDGPIDSTKLNSNYSMVFLPNEFAQKLRNFGKYNNDSIQVRTFKTGLFDYSLLILWLTANFCVFVGALLCKREFMKM